MAGLSHLPRRDGHILGKWVVRLISNPEGITSVIPFAPTTKDGAGVVLEGPRLRRTMAAMADSFTIWPLEPRKTLEEAGPDELERLRRCGADWVLELEREAKDARARLEDGTQRAKSVRAPLEELVELWSMFPTPATPEPVYEATGAAERHIAEQSDGVRRMIRALEDLELQLFADGRGVRSSIPRSYSGTEAHLRWRRGLEVALFDKLRADQFGRLDLEELKEAETRSVPKLAGGGFPEEIQGEGRLAPEDHAATPRATKVSMQPVAPTHAEEVALVRGKGVKAMWGMARELEIKSYKKYRAPELAKKIVNALEVKRREVVARAMQRLDELARTGTQEAREVAGRLLAEFGDQIRPTLEDYFAKALHRSHPNGLPAGADGS